MAQRPHMPGMRRTNPLVLLLTILLVPVMAFLDLAAGPEFGFSLLYIIPIVLVARFGGLMSAWFTVILATLGWTIIDILTTDYTTVFAPIWNSLTRLAFFSFALIAVRSTREQLRSAEWRALSDPLTDLPNRRYLLIMLEAASARLERLHRPLVLAYIDIDNFKQVNDIHGHGAGDRLLQRVAHVLVDSTRETDTVARIGGDEFVILLPETGLETATHVLERVHGALRAMSVPHGTDISFSAGAVVFYRPLESAEAMIREADERMYRVKKQGKDALAVSEVR